MNWFKKIIKAVKEFFIGREVEPMPAPIQHETPVDAEERRDEYERDIVNDGNTKSPDWSYIADNITLDKESAKHDTMAWYYGQFLKVEGRIREAERFANAPWWFIAGIHMRESSFSVKGHFANGDDIIGTNRKTYRWPKGLGPAATWEESVRQAMEYERRVSSNFDKLVNKDMGFREALEAWEIYNGLGFRSKGEYSEYVVGFTNFHDETGRYVADGRFSRSAKVVRPGAAGMVLYLLEKGKVKPSELWF